MASHVKKERRHVDEMNVDRGLILHNLIFFFPFAFEIKHRFENLFCAHYGRYWYSVTF